MQGQAFFLRKRRNHFSKPLDPIMIRRIGSSCHSIIDLGALFSTRRVLSLPFPAAQPGNTNKPPAKTIRIAQCAQLVIGPHKYILCQVLGVCKIPNHIIAHGTDQRRVTVV